MPIFKFIYFLSICFLGISGETKVSENKINKELLDFYKSKRTYSCITDLNKDTRKINLYYEGKNYIGEIDEHNNPYGEWDTYFFKECYLDDVEILKSDDSLTYKSKDGYFDEGKNYDGTINVYIEKEIENRKYKRVYIIKNNEIIQTYENPIYVKKESNSIKNILKSNGMTQVRILK